MRTLPFLGLIASLATSCETRRPVSTPAVSGPPLLARPVAAPPTVPPDTADCLRARPAPEPGPADTLIAIGSRHCWLSVRVSTDSTKALDYAPAMNAGAAFAAPSDTTNPAARRVRGYAETYTFTLRDSVRHQRLWQHRLHKPDFYAAAGREIATVMNLARPAYLGYSAALDALVFACYLWIPASDVGERATLLLDRQGHLKRISPSGSSLWDDAIDCDPQLSPSGRAVLTCTELLRAGHPPLSLKKPHAQLHVARFLNDSTLLTVYKNGDYQTQKTSVASNNDAIVMAPMVSVDFITTPAQHRLPTAFIVRTDGRILRKFFLAPSGAATNFVPHTWVKTAHAYLLYEENTKLVLVPKPAPEKLVELPLKNLSRFKPPLRLHEKLYTIETDFSHLKLYVDTLHPQQVRYHLQRPD